MENWFNSIMLEPTKEFMERNRAKVQIVVGHNNFHLPITLHDVYSIIGISIPLSMPCGKTIWLFLRST